MPYQKYQGPPIVVRLGKARFDPVSLQLSSLQNPKMENLDAEVAQYRKSFCKLEKH